MRDRHGGYPSRSTVPTMPVVDGLPAPGARPRPHHLTDRRTTMPPRRKPDTNTQAAAEPSPVDPMDKARDELRLAHQQRDNARDQLAAARRAVTDAQVELDAAERAVVDAERAWTQVGLQ